MAYDAIKFIHVLAVVFMSAPLYNLIVVNERVRFGKAPLAVDGPVFRKHYPGRGQPVLYLSTDGVSFGAAAAPAWRIRLERSN